jgi:hypothetical protein
VPMDKEVLTELDLSFKRLEQKGYLPKADPHVLYRGDNTIVLTGPAPRGSASASSRRAESRRDRIRQFSGG